MIIILIIFSKQYFDIKFEMVFSVQEPFYDSNKYYPGHRYDCYTTKNISITTNLESMSSSVSECPIYSLIANFLHFYNARVYPRSLLC